MEVESVSIPPSDFELIQVSGGPRFTASLSVVSLLAIYVLCTTKPAAWGPRVDVLAIFIMFQSCTRDFFLIRTYLQPRTLPAARDYGHTHPEYRTHASALWQFFLVDARQPPRLAKTLEMDCCQIKGK